VFRKAQKKCVWAGNLMAGCAFASMSGVRGFTYIALECTDRTLCFRVRDLHARGAATLNTGDSKMSSELGGPLVSRDDLLFGIALMATAAVVLLVAGLFA